MMNLWKYDNPKQSAVRFISLIDSAEASSDKDYLPALLSQIARSYAMRGDFKSAHEQLNELELLIQDRSSRGQIFYLLERGRALKAGGDKKRARILFNDAFIIADRLGDDYLAIDAAHMMAITETLPNQHKWHVIAVNIAEASTSEFARNWLGTLYNNMAWTYFEKGRYEKALELFKQVVQFRKEKEQLRRAQIARWAVGRTLRELNRLPQALTIQEKLFDERTSIGQEADGLVVEEIAEIYHLLGRSEAKSYFAQAYRLLVLDPGLVQNEPARLKRLKDLSMSED
jgi:tetratricopeptide (TPR) repeat protein